MKILPFTLCCIGFLLGHHSAEGTFAEIVKRMTLKYSCPNNQFAVAMPQDSGCHPRIQITCSPNAIIKFGHYCWVSTPGYLQDTDRKLTHDQTSGQLGFRQAINYQKLTGNLPTYGLVDIFLPRPLKTGDRISLIGTPTADVKWELALTSGDAVVLYMVVKFTFQGHSQVAFDCYTPQLGWWTCKGTAASFPFEVNREFKTTILVRDVDFKIYVDGVEIYTFANKFPAAVVNKLYVANDVTIKAVLLI